MVGTGSVVGEERLNVSKLVQEEAAQMTEIIHGSLCLGERMSSDMVKKCKKY